MVLTDAVPIRLMGVVCLLEGEIDRGGWVPCLIASVEEVVERSAGNTWDSLTTVKVTQKGQVTIPLEVRRALGITTGSDVEL